MYLTSEKTCYSFSPAHQTWTLSICWTYVQQGTWETWLYLSCWSLTEWFFLTLRYCFIALTSELASVHGNVRKCMQTFANVNTFGPPIGRFQISSTVQYSLILKWSFTQNYSNEIGLFEHKLALIPKVCGKNNFETGAVGTRKLSLTRTFLASWLFRQAWALHWYQASGPGCSKAD